ncbi:MAG TPA: hypothetical protein VG899_10695 [Mycobacteriales bacterium]|nr:hypothetical protein [Mycobacteriales bacterium]
MSEDLDYVDEHGMRLLAEKVPLSLLIDLATPVHSREVYRSEPADTSWLVATGAA